MAFRFGFDVGAGDAEVDIISYVAFMMRAQYKGYLVLCKSHTLQHALQLAIRGRNKARQGSIKPVP